MNIIIGLVLIYLCSVGFSAKYREKYLEEKETNVELKEKLIKKSMDYETELLEIYSIAKGLGWNGEKY